MARKTIFIYILILVQVIFVLSSEAVAEREGKVSEEISDILLLSEEIKGLRKDVSDIKKEIKELKSLIELRLPTGSSPPNIARPGTGKTNIEDDPFMGSMDAPLVLVEFSDYQCPFCERFFRNTLPIIKKDYIDSGKVKYVFKDFPLSFHKQAQKAAEAAHCAGEAGKYWEMHDMMFESPKNMDVDNLMQYAKKLGLDEKDFKKCLQDNRYAEGIKKDLAAGIKSGVRGTPSFILGRLNGEGEVEGNLIRGARPFGVFKTIIESMLKKTDLKDLAQLEDKK